VRGRFGQHVQEWAARAQHTEKLETAGVTVLARAAGQEGPVEALAFPDSETVLAGDLDLVKAALGTTRGAPRPLQAKAALLRAKYDVWVIAESPGTALPASLPSQESSLPPQQVLSSVREFSGGLRFGTDLEIAADVTASSQPEAEKLAAALDLLMGLVRQQSGAADPRTARLFEGLQFARQGNVFHFSLTLPEAELNQAFRARLGRSGSAGGQRPRAQPDQIIIQSSPEDMGTVVIPVAPPKQTGK
jgi:hypothetical protein